jgi:peptide/nickel transport system substrate-binding protein
MLAGISAGLPAPAQAEGTYAIAMHGAPALPDGFAALPYANPDAPKGGRIVEGVLGTFDSLNPFIVQGDALQPIRGYVVESLMARSYDEPFTLYGLLARTVETDDARSYVTFSLDPAAHFSDGSPVTADDVVFSWQLLRDHGRPNHRTYYSKVAKAEILDPRTVRFDFADLSDRELPLILGLMPVLPKHAIDVSTFENSTLHKPIGSGPYVVATVDAGKSVSFKRDPNYWGRGLTVNRGLWNFDEVKFDFYRDGNAYFEAFKAGAFDVRSETDPGRWQTGYNFPAARDGRVVKESFPTGLPKFASDFVFNTRRPIFADIRVRQAITLLFDFQWINRNFFYNLYQRSASYFDDSELSAYHRAADDRERALLAPYPGAVRADVLDGTWSPPVTDGSGYDRTTLRAAFTLLNAAGYALKGTTLQNQANGRPFAFEIMVTSRDDERLALAFANMLKRAGIVMQVRLVDDAQYQERLSSYDFDMIEYRWEQSLSPGNEQSFYFGAAAADQPGSRNYMGVKSAAVDAMIAALLRARQRPDFVAAIRALDRVLMSGSYVVPLFYLPQQWVARWTAIRHPERTSLYGYLPETWWHQPNLSTGSALP